jgi:PhnB protein
MTGVQPVPDGYPRIVPYLYIDGAADAIAFYTDVLGAKERGRMPAPDGKIGHAELEFGDAVIMLSDEWPDMDALGPKTVGGTPVGLHLYVDDVDDAFARAVQAGATAVAEPEDKFYGDRSCTVTDPWGHRWYLATHVEDVSPEEMEKRAAEAMGG